MAFRMNQNKIGHNQVPDEPVLEHSEEKEPEIEGYNLDKKKSLRRWRLIVSSLGIFIGILVSIYGVISYTSTSSFCSNCHAMAPESVTFQASAHNQIKCIDCHIAPGTANLVVHKVESLKEVYNHIVGPPDPIIQTVPVLDENCKRCHSGNRLVSATGDLIVNHDGHIKEGIPCITCHSGVAHAKIVERGINGAYTYDTWTKQNSDKLVNKEYMKPNMGTCIDCHDQVNQGKEPWKDNSYRLTEKPVTEKIDEASKFKWSAEMEAGILEREIPKNTQRIILEAIGKQKAGAKISMECFTCHQKINTPKNHERNDWGIKHGSYAITELGLCLDCHHDSKWIKKVEKQDIKKLIYSSKEKVTYTQDLKTVTKEANRNTFCVTCHSHQPENHLDRSYWLYFGHPQSSNTAEEIEGCLVCHDMEKPEPNSKDIKPPSDVYCEFCHKAGFVVEGYE